MDGALLRARAFVRIDRVNDAISELTATVPPYGAHRQSAEHRTILAYALARANDPAAAEAALLEADVYATFVRDPELIAEVARNKALAKWVAGDYSAAAEIAAGALDDAAPVASARLLTLLGLVAFVNGDRNEQLALFREALITFDRAGSNDVYLQAYLLNNLAIPAAELNPPDIREIITQRLNSIAWNDETTRLQFHVTYQLAWLDALAGDHLSSFGRFREASKLAPSAAWKALALYGRAYLAREMNETLTAAECIADAESTIAGVNWANADADESLVLLLLAVLVARTDAGGASSLLQQYTSVKGSVDRTLAAAHHNGLRSGIEAQALGLIADAQGRQVKAVRFLRKSYDHFMSVGSTWRAAVAALDIYDITHDEDMFVFAREQAARVPQSWLARRLIQTSPLPEFHKDVTA
ncbi:MAG: hypothetical protein NVSMB5_02980 [Candidatus Velthaea sp.]